MSKIFEDRKFAKYAIKMYDVKMRAGFIRFRMWSLGKLLQR
jgi:hypothetical protein